MNQAIGREFHISAMNEALVSSKAEFVALTGRRRVGKTYLVHYAFKDKIDFELSGIYKGTKAQQLQVFMMSMEQYFPALPISNKPKTWLEAFNLLTKALESVKKNEKKVIFLDELPWLASKRTDFLPALSWFWNSWAQQNNIVLVVCGSAASWMIDKVINNKGGLHNRVTLLLHLRPFNLYETEKFLISRGVKLNRYEIAKIYMTIGGIPMYLEQIKPGLSAIQNIQALCFSVNGYLRTEFDRLFASLFENHENHVSIVQALSTKRKGMLRTEIIEKSTLANGGMLTNILRELKYSGFIEEYGSFDKKTKDSLYRLTDPYSHFYLAYIEPLGRTSIYTFKNFSDLSSWTAWSGYAFENLCMNHLYQIKEALSINGMSTIINSFNAKPKDGLKGAQIDLVISRKDNAINICEIKYSNTIYTLTKSEAENIANKHQVFAYHTKTKKQLYTTLITPYGVADNEHKASTVDQVIVLDDLFINEKVN